jgi:hypothetical protein
LIDENNYMIVWQSINGDGWEIFGRLFNRNAAVGPEFLINVTVVSNQERPRIAAFSSPTLQENSRYIVTWRSLWQDSDGYGTYARIYGNTGTPIGGEIHLATFTVDSQQDPEIVFLSSGGATDDGFVAVWSHMTDGFGWSIHYRLVFSSLLSSISLPPLYLLYSVQFHSHLLFPLVQSIPKHRGSKSGPTSQRQYLW